MALVNPPPKLQSPGKEPPVAAIAPGLPWLPRWIALVAGPMAALALYLLPFPNLPAGAHALAAILSCVVLYWILEPIPLPVTALLGAAWCVVAGLGSAKSIFAAYGHPIIFLFLGSFLLAEAMAAHGLDRRVAAWVLAFSWVRGRPSHILLALGAATAVISMWISNTAATAMMLPIGLGVLRTFEQESSEAVDRYKIGLMLMLSFAATAGGAATIIGTPPNLIGAGLIAQQVGVSITFSAWLTFGVPLACLMLLTAWALLLRLYPPAGPSASGAPPQAEPRRAATREPWTRGQVNVCLAFIVAVTLWIGPGLLGATLGVDHTLVVWLESHLPNELVALFAAGLLFMLPGDPDGAPALSWKQAANINWGIILLFGGGLAFGELMQQTGLSEAAGTSFVNLFGSGTVWSLTAVSIAAGVLLSELASNTVSATMIIPLIIAIAQTAGVPAVPPALGACLGASLGFALPVSTPPNAIVYATGLVPMKSMICAGIVFDLLASILIWLVLRLMCPIMGLV